MNERRSRQKGLRILTISIKTNNRRWPGQASDDDVGKRKEIMLRIVKNVKRFITIPEKGFLCSSVLKPTTTMMMMMGWIVNWPNRHIKQNKFVFFPIHAAEGEQREERRKKLQQKMLGSRPLHGTMRHSFSLSCNFCSLPGPWHASTMIRKDIVDTEIIGTYISQQKPTRDGWLDGQKPAPENGKL